MSDNRSSPQFAEAYVNRCYEGNEATRWWAHPLILVGGSICDAADFRHLQQDFGIAAVISVESEHSDEGKVPADILLHLPTPDDGTPPSYQHWVALRDAGRRWIAAARSLMMPRIGLYVHCQQGGSRSPAAAYLVMREALGMIPRDALSQIRGFKSDYGAHAYHQSYIRSAEEAIAKIHGTPDITLPW